MSNIIHMPKKSPFVVAVDGMAGAGKRTLGMALAAHYGFAYLDTGLIYRAVAALALIHNISLDNEAQCLEICNRFSAIDLEREGLRSETVGQAASIIASIPGVRQRLLRFQRDFVTNSADSGGVILDGRDIGTVVWPGADVKLFMTVDLPAAADRRYKQLQTLGIPSIYDDILQEMQVRGLRDQSRAAAPMQPAEDAYVLDTTKLSINEVLSIAMQLIDQKHLGEASGDSQNNHAAFGAN
jgi:cytidylate kinase